MYDADLRFLPLARMREVAAETHDSYPVASPFPHAVIDNLFDPEVLSHIIEEFPGPSDINWRAYKNSREVKLATSQDEHFRPMTRMMLYHLNSAPFLEFLSEITHIENLVADSFFEGGGMHQIERGGKLAIHADFNKHPRTQLDRRLNVLVYLNKNWDDEFGGHFEMWDRGMTHCVKKVSPLFNRMVIFSTTESSFHGHPDELRCPQGTTRKSLALYYYTNGRPIEEISEGHTTLFRERPGEKITLSGKARLKELAKDLLPPLVVRTISNMKSGPS